MTDTTVSEAAEAAPVDFIAKITLPGGLAFEINFSQLSDDPAKAIVEAGLEAILRKANGMAKLITGITKVEGAELEKRKAEIVKAAQKTIDQLSAGQVPGRKAEKTSGAVGTEAMRLAKNMVKDLIRNSGQKIGAYSAKEITAAAKVVLERNPKLIELAKENLSKRVDEAKGSKALDLKGLFGAKAESEEVKAKQKVPPKPKGKKDQLSAKQAGQVAPRQKPTTVSHTAH